MALVLSVNSPIGVLLGVLGYIVPHKGQKVHMFILLFESAHTFQWRVQDAASGSDYLNKLLACWIW
jgi:hypothetical protein